MNGGNGERPLVDGRTAENVTSEVVECIRIWIPGRPEPMTVRKEELLAIDLAGCAVAWKDAEDKIHRMVGAPLELVAVKSRILRPT